MDREHVDERSSDHREQELKAEEERVRRQHDRAEQKKLRVDERAADLSALASPAFDSVRSWPFRTDALAIIRQLDIGGVVEVAVSAWTGGLGSGGVLALTDRRLIFYRSHVFADAECQSLPRSEIQGADVHKEPISMDLRIDSSSGRVTFKGIRPKKLAWQILGRLVLVGDGTAA